MGRKTMKRRRGNVDNQFLHAHVVKNEKTTVKASSTGTGDSTTDRTEDEVDIDQNNYYDKMIATVMHAQEKDPVQLNETLLGLAKSDLKRASQGALVSTAIVDAAQRAHNSFVLSQLAFMKEEIKQLKKEQDGKKELVLLPGDVYEFSEHSREPLVASDFIIENAHPLRPVNVRAAMNATLALFKSKTRRTLAREMTHLLQEVFSQMVPPGFDKAIGISDNKPGQVRIPESTIFAVSRLIALHVRYRTGLSVMPAQEPFDFVEWLGTVRDSMTEVLRNGPFRRTNQKPRWFPKSEEAYLIQMKLDTENLPAIVALISKEANGDSVNSPDGTASSSSDDSRAPLPSPASFTSPFQSASMNRMQPIHVDTTGTTVSSDHASMLPTTTYTSLANQNSQLSPVNGQLPQYSANVLPAINASSPTTSASPLPSPTNQHWAQPHPQSYVQNSHHLHSVHGILSAAPPSYGAHGNHAQNFSSIPPAYYMNVQMHNQSDFTRNPNSFLGLTGSSVPPEQTPDGSTVSSPSNPLTNTREITDLARM